MKGIKKLAGIRTLMLTSAVLLLLLIIRWLQSEFEGEKEVMHKQLFTEFMDATREVMDSMIAMRLVNPILNDPAGFRLETFTQIDLQGPVDTVNIYSEEFNKDAILPSIESECDTCLPGSATYKIKVGPDALIYEGVKVFLNRTDSLHRGMREYISEIDTVILQKSFAAKIDSSGIDVIPVWKRNKNWKMQDQEELYFESHFFEYPYGVLITGYESYLFKKNIPEILFSVLLLLIISIAFIFSFRSLRDQMRLAILKDDLISNISHELKTPVATVKVAVETMLQMDPAEKKEKIKEYLTIAQEEINRLELLVNKVMNSVLMENGNHFIRPESVDLSKIIEQTIQIMQIQLNQKNAEVRFDNLQTNTIIEGDIIHLKGIIYNLIDNSLKYGTEAPIIEIGLKHADDHLILSFTDNGPGIPADYQDKIFEKFFRVPDGNKHKVKGYGLGLFYVAEIMQKMGGSISVKNNPGTGCTFILKFLQTQ